MKFKGRLISLLLLLSLLLSLVSCNLVPPPEEPSDTDTIIDLETIPEFSGKSWIAINGNIPYFTEEEIVSTSYEFYSELDSLGRCGVTHACVGTDIMPTEPRGDIQSVKPTGWIQATYSASLVDGGYLYNRCHLIGWQLTGENANKKNLITGTKFMNNDGMLRFENQVDDYLEEEPDNHVMYRSTPIFVGNELVARGVLLEAWSVEDEGDGICFCVYIYNAQPGITIDYATGASWLSGGTSPDNTPPEGTTYYVNTTTKKFHKPDCTYASSANAVPTTKTRDELIEDGKIPCGTCKP
ncbi:MAG: DNA/RNA non-specific endonuclease [Clostridia bacterium]|nr:DNA/RNA non-specific endonuclease [Clostridia bacterium]